MNNKKIVVDVLLMLFCESISKDICRGTEHRRGKWILDRHRQTKNYYCCGYDSLDHRHNESVCGGINLKGRERWYGSDDGLTQVGGDSCRCDRTNNQRTVVSEREKYSWFPDTCTLPTWNGSDFCSLLGNRIIFLQGDSTMGQSAYSLMSMIFTFHGNCSKQIYFVRSTSANALKEIQAVRADIAIINFGAHAHSDEELISMQDDFNNAMQSNQMNALRKERKVIFLWRTNHPGHVNCNNYLKPSQLGIDEFPQYNRSLDIYNWSGFNRWDDISVQNAISLDMQVLDVSPIYYRADAHSDCLHYCLPGPVDLFTILLYQKLITGEI